jgi:hypothetical protein
LSINKDDDMTTLRDRRLAFALTDLAALLAITGVLLAIFLAALSDVRRNARLDEDIASLQRFGAATGAFAADNEDLLWGLSWQAGGVFQMLQLDGTYQDVSPASDLEGSGLQTVHLIRLLGDRIGDNGMPLVNGFIGNVFYSHLPLMEYLGEDPLARWTVSTADEIKLDWKDDPENKFDNGVWLPLQPDPTPTNRRWPYSAGFRVVPAAWDYNQSELANEFNALRVQQGSTHNTFLIPGGADFYGRTLADVAYPAHKVHMHDSHQRHFGPDIQFFGAVIDEDGNAVNSEARIPVLNFDASARVRSAEESNPGWRPNSPFFPCMTFFYQPAAWEPATVSAKLTDFSIGRYYWTRGGLKGIDFGALPLDTGQPQPGECDL